MIVTTPSGAMRMNALSAVAAPASSPDVSAIVTFASGGRIACSNRPPPAAALAFRNERREGIGDNDPTAARRSEPGRGHGRHGHFASAAVDRASAAFLIAARMRK